MISQTLQYGRLDTKTKIKLRWDKLNEDDTDASKKDFDKMLAQIQRAYEIAKAQGQGERHD